MRIKKAVQKELNRLLHPFDLSSIHALYLCHLLEEPDDGLMLSELTRLVDVDKAHTTRVVSDLQKKGYIEKRSDGGAQRYHIVLTERGRTAAEAVDAAMNEMKDSILLQITPDEKQGFLSVSSKVVVLLTGLSEQ